MNIVGVDQSLTCTGLARLTPSGDIITSRVITRPATSLVETRDRIRYVVGQVLKFVGPETFAVLEAPIIPQHNGGQVLERAWLFGMLVDQLLVRGAVVQVRVKTRAMYATGNGNAEKAEVLAAMRATHPGVDIPDDNVADALALLGMGARHRGVPIDGPLEKKQERAMTAVVWPDKRRD